MRRPRSGWRIRAIPLCPDRRRSTLRVPGGICPGPGDTRKKSGVVHPTKIDVRYEILELPVTSRSEARFPRIIGEHRTKAQCPRRDSDRRHRAQQESFELRYTCTRKKIGEAGRSRATAWRRGRPPSVRQRTRVLVPWGASSRTASPSSGTPVSLSVPKSR